MDTANSRSLSEASPSVQAHLGILQGVIQRMAANCSACKAWCITVVSAVLVLVADKGKPEFAYIALIPTLLFLALDAYYLGLEKGFLKTYNEFVEKLHAGNAIPADLFAVLPSGNQSSQQIKALLSFSVWGFYSTLFILVAVARSLVL